MFLNLKLHNYSEYPKGGILIKNPSINFWLQEMDRMQLSLIDYDVYPLPSDKANVLYGCLIVSKTNDIPTIDMQKAVYMYLVKGQLFLPQKTKLEPLLTEREWEQLLENRLYIMHPEIGFFELAEKIQWEHHFSFPFQQKKTIITQPQQTVFVPSVIRSAQIAFEEEEIERKIKDAFGSEEIIPKLPFNMDKIRKGNKKEIEKLLAYLEKNPEAGIKYAIPLDHIGATRGSDFGVFTFNSNTFFIKFRNKISNLLHKIGGNKNKNSGGKFIGLPFLWILFVFLKGMAIGNATTFLSLLGFIVIAILVYLFIATLFSNIEQPSVSNGASVIIDKKQFNTLQDRYDAIAKNFIKNKEYFKASNIYLNLIKNNYLAAKTLEEGGLYNEAALLYEKNTNNLSDAARCYEFGRSYTKAIEIYKQLQNTEKVGDIYTIIDNSEEASRYYEITVTSYKDKHNYLEASRVLLDKMHLFAEAQDILLEGWRQNYSKLNLLEAYCNNIKDEAELQEALLKMYTLEINSANQTYFLEVLKKLYHQQDKLKDFIRLTAYEIISNRSITHPDIVSSLMFFNDDNVTINKDILRYKVFQKKK